MSGAAVGAGLTLETQSMTQHIDDYYLFRETSGNTKTGPLPYGALRREHWATGCSGCPMYSEGDCYAINGRFGTHHMVEDRPGTMANRALREPQRYTLAAALALAPRAVSLFRWDVIGDGVGAVPKAVLEDAYLQTAAAGLHPIVYTHQWKAGANRWARDWARASVDHIEDLPRAMDYGFVPVLTVDADEAADIIEAGGDTMTLPGGEVADICPSMVADYRGERPVQCATCRLCSVSATPGARIVVFPRHGLMGAGRRWGLRKRAWRKIKKALGGAA